MSAFVETLVAVVMCSICFAAGVMLSDRYHRMAAEEQKLALQKQYARLMAGVDADDTAQPYVYAHHEKKKIVTTPEFVDRLKTNGSATKQINAPRAMSAGQT